MNELLQESVFFGVAISLLTYFGAVQLKKTLKSGFLNPLLLSIIATIVLLLLFRVDYQTYYAGAKYLNYLLTPATVCLAIPLYEQFTLLKKNAAAVLAGIFSGVLTSLICVLALAALFSFSHGEYVTVLPKSITTAIGIAISEELGGNASITATVIIMTGVTGNVIAEGFLKLLRVREPIARGIAIGTASHAIGTGKAVELGEVEGAFSGLSIVVAGLLTVIGAPLFAALL